jgi:hypothetical protein
MRWDIVLSEERSTFCEPHLDRHLSWRFSSSLTKQKIINFGEENERTESSPDLNSWEAKERLGMREAVAKDDRSQREVNWPPTTPQPTEKKNLEPTRRTCD